MSNIFYHLNAWVYVYPRDGEWSQKQFDEIIYSCSKVPSLASATPFAKRHGFRFKQTDAVRRFQRKIPAAAGMSLGGDIRINDFKFHFKGTDKYVKCLQLLAKYGPSRTQLLDLTKVFEENGHIVLGAHGIYYRLSTNNLKTAEEAGMDIRHHAPRHPVEAH